ncbi:hypothetical protein F8388_009209 [Cannabis sativa]|uniref:FAD dependent oxidoreductase domain-containing protein n=2 Tax=Cannabis sativa TaxID=3483 RepID=A0A7J6GK43_CANSA|nr:hypothetical protein F8388_009209 [Cannabis sativa]
MAPLLQKRFFCSEVPKKWAVKQVTKSNFAESMEEIKHDISTSDFVAVSLQKTGSFSAPWHRAHPFDTAETSYYKAKYAAERFQIFQFAVCPFSVNASKLVAHPYNYLLFPRDELKLGMPSYSFSCQTSYLTSMAREGFDFNACIYDGISYLSRAQEDKAKIRIGNPRPSPLILDSTSTPSVADALFIERVKSRVIQWKKTCKKTKENTHDALMNSLRKLILGSEFYGSRPCITIDVCTERQVKLALEMLRDFADELVPVLIPGRSGGTQAVRVVLTSSQEDKDLFESELQRLEEEENKKVRGFREVIDLISASQKPVVSYNSLNGVYLMPESADLTFIHSKFIAPLPPTVDEFASSLSKIFPCVLDVSHLMTFIGPLRKVTNIPVAISLLNSHFFAPVDIEILYKAADNEGKIHGHNAVRISHLFAKLCSILKIDPNSNTSDSQVLSAPALTESTNIFNALSTSFEESIDEEISVWTKSKRKVNCEQLVYLWGFGSENTAGKLKTMLHNSHSIFSEEFDIRLVDKSCAVIVFWQPGLAEKFLDVMNNIEKISGSLREMVSEGLRAASYETYKRACKLDIWEANLGESLDRALEDSEDAKQIKRSLTGFTVSPFISSLSTKQPKKSTVAMAMSSTFTTSNPYLLQNYVVFSPHSTPSSTFGYQSTLFASKLTKKCLSFTAIETRPDSFSRPALNPISASAQTFDVVVVGAGVIGLTIARQFLLGSDLSVAVVDKAVPCSGATGAGQGYLWMAHKTPGSDIWDLALRSHELWRELAGNLKEQGVDPQEHMGWKNTGSLLIGRTPKEVDVLKKQVKSLQDAGVRSEFLSATDLLSKEPSLLIENDGGAAFLPGDCQLDAHRAVDLILKANRHFISKGRYAEFFYDPVTTLIRTGSSGKVIGVKTAKNTLFCNKAIIVAAGCWSGSLVQDLFRDSGIVLDVPVKPRKGHLLVLKNFNFLQLNHGMMEAGYLDHKTATQLPDTSTSVISDHDQNLSISMTATIDSMGNVVLAFNLTKCPVPQIGCLPSGSSRQFAGFNTETEESVINLIWERAMDFFPKLREQTLSDFIERREVRVGLRPYMPDGKPVIGPVPGLSNVLLATGHEGGGLSMALGTAEMVADMVLGNPEKIKSAPFAVQGRCLNFFIKISTLQHKTRSSDGFLHSFVCEVSLKIRVEPPKTMAVSNLQRLSAQIHRLPALSFYSNSLISRSSVTSTSPTSPSPSSSRKVSDRIVKLFAIDLDGKKREIVGLTGHTLLKTLANAGMIEPASHRLEDIDACSAECEVNVAQEWLDRLPGRSYDEEFILKKYSRARVLNKHSRLSCQVVLSPDLQGMVVAVPEAKPWDIP